jgi:hypothetical protein
VNRGKGFGTGGVWPIPLSRTLYVDPATSTPITSQNGAINAPFSTITAALAAASDRTTIILQPDDYTGEGSLTAPAVAELSLACMFASLSTATIGPMTATGVTLSFFGVQAVGDVSCLSLWCQFNSGVFGDVTAPQSANFIDQSYLVGDITTAWLSAIHSDIYGSGSADNMYAISSGMPDTLNVVSYVELVSCWWDPGGGTWTFTGAPGQIILDAYSNWYWKTTSQVLANGTKVIAGDLVP